jgi:DNA adenine methylase
VEKIKPFLKWAGGKYRLVPILREKFPVDGKRFVEPFVAAGSVALNVDYPKYLIADNNGDLISVWKYLRSNGSRFISKCEKLYIPENNTREAFDRLRHEFNHTNDRIRKAALFVYLNRHCFNGLCRYNSKKLFNVPFGRYKDPHFPKEEMEACLPKLKTFDIYKADFRKIFKLVESGDVVYCDPPYVPLSQTASFNDYTSEGFGLQDQIDLAKCAQRAARRGATVVVSNHSNWTTNEVFGKMFGGKISKILVSRTISSKADERVAVEEIVAVFSPYR